MAENLKTTKYNDGSSIPLVTDGTAWAALSSPGYCWYNNDAASYKDLYGALYNWYATEPAGNGGKNICPTGWHLPAQNEWVLLDSYLDPGLSGGKLKETGTSHWGSPNTGASNESGFSALPGGYRSWDRGFFAMDMIMGNWWTLNTGPNDTYSQIRYLSYNLNLFQATTISMRTGYSVRCIKDN